MKKLHVRYDPGSQRPYRWRVEIEDERGGITPVDPGFVRASPSSLNTTREGAESLVASVALSLGVRDLSSPEEWASRGFEVVWHAFPGA